MSGKNVEGVVAHVTQCTHQIHTNRRASAVNFNSVGRKKGSRYLVWSILLFPLKRTVDDWKKC